MGDRCYMRLTCRRTDLELFKKIGFHLDFDQGPDDPIIEMVDHDANYAHYDQMPTNVPYFGHHDAGGEYADGVFACDGRRYVNIEAGHCGGFVVGWITKRNKPNPQSLRAVRKYLSVSNRVQKVFQKLSEKDRDCHMKVITVHRLSLQFDASQITHGNNEQQVRDAVELINLTLQREPFGLGAQLIVHRDEIEIECPQINPAA